MKRLYHLFLVYVYLGHKWLRGKIFKKEDIVMQGDFVYDSKGVSSFKENVNGKFKMIIHR